MGSQGQSIPALLCSQQQTCYQVQIHLFQLPGGMNEGMDGVYSKKSKPLFYYQVQNQSTPFNSAFIDE